MKLKDIRLLILGCKDFPPFHNKKIISGGMEVYTYELVNILSQKLKISLIKGRGKEPADTSFLNGFKLYETIIMSNSVIQPVSLTVFSLLKTLQIIKHINIINPQTPLSALIGVFCKFFFKKPYFVCVHIFGSTKEHAGNSLFAKIYFAIEKLTLSYADAVVTAGDSLTDFLIEVHKLPKDKIIMIHPGIDSAEVKIEQNVLREKYDITDKDFVLLYLGRFIKEKGIFDLLDAVKILKKMDIKIKVIFAGSGELKKNIYEEISINSLEEYVLVIEPVFGNAKNQLIKRADIMVRTSYHEVFPVTYLEALSLGTPVIATPVGDVGYVAEISGAIKLVPVNNPQKIAEGIIRLKDAPDELQRMSENGFKYVNSISWERQAEKYTKVIKDIMERQKL